jgi:hypothetical protein
MPSKIGVHDETGSVEFGWERPLLNAVTAAASLPTDGWEFGRTGGHRCSFRSVERDMFVKLTTAPGADEMALEARVASWAATVGLPTIGLVPLPVLQPVTAPGGLATFWHLHAALPYLEVDMRWMGEALRAVHQHESAAGVELAPWDPEAWFVPEVKALRAHPSVDPEVLHRLEEYGERVLARAATLVQGRRLSVLHGDPHAGNVVRTHVGEQLFCDFELAQIGPPRMGPQRGAGARAASRRRAPNRAAHPGRSNRRPCRADRSDLTPRRQRER